MIILLQVGGYMGKPLDKPEEQMGTEQKVCSVRERKNA